MISAFISGKDNKTKDLRAFAQQNLRGLPFDQLRMDDLRHAREHTGRDQVDMLAHHSIECDLEEVDAFVSHAWDDDHEQRYVALRAWATQFESEHGRTPIIWLGMRSLPPILSISPLSPSCVSLALSDKACIDQSSIEESLQCLPIFLSHCESFVLLGGPHWLTRLWWYVCLLLFLRYPRATHTAKLRTVYLIQPLSHPPLMPYVPRGTVFSSFSPSCASAATPTPSCSCHSKEGYRNQTLWVRRTGQAKRVKWRKTKRVRSMSNRLNASS